MTYYEMLEISETASEEVVRMAYKALARKYHPDVYSGDPLIAEEKMKQLNEAYSVLCNCEKRKEYDAQLNAQRGYATSNTFESYTINKKIRKNTYRKVCVVALVVVLIVCAVVYFINEHHVQDIEYVKDSVVMIEVYDEKESLVATGSGFCTYRENWIVTNYHVIEGAKTIQIITDERKSIDVDNIVFFNSERDLAVLSFDGKLNPLKIGNSKDIKTKDNITTVGSPKGELNTVSEGIISNVDNKEEIRISAPISHGSSGGVLLDSRNQVIGITSAGYDDAQNLNFAISVSVLEDLYLRYTEGDVVNISKNNIGQYIGNLIDFEPNIKKKASCYAPSSLETFFMLTDKQERFERLLAEEDTSWFWIYDSLGSNDKEMIVELFDELLLCEFTDSNVDRDITEWDTTEFFISLGVLNRYEYAITLVDVANYSDKDHLFDNVDENYPLEAAEKSLVLYLLGDYDWSEIHTDNKEDIFDYFDQRYGVADFGAILEMLGYEVVYESDGSLTAYW